MSEVVNPKVQKVKTVRRFSGFLSDLKLTRPTSGWYWGLRESLQYVERLDAKRAAATAAALSVRVIEAESNSV